jgi:ribosomal protein L37AE/L43A
VHPEEEEVLREAADGNQKLNAVKGSANHPIVNNTVITIPDKEHMLVQFQPGTYGPTRGNRRKQLACRHCPNVDPVTKERISRQTTWYCSKCEVGFHPQCFFPWHAANKSSPAKKRKFREEDDGEALDLLT